MFRRMLIGATLLIALVAAPAAAQYDFNVTPGEVTPGGSVTVSGEGCSAGAEVTITMTQLTAARAVGDTTTVATVIADENGQFTVTFDIPADTALGSYEIAAFCDGEQVGTATIDVVDGTVTTTPPSGSNEPIVRTGSDLNGLGLAGAGLITVGGIIVLATRSRRHQARA